MARLDGGRSWTALLELEEALLLGLDGAAGWRARLDGAGREARACREVDERWPEGAGLS